MFSGHSKELTVRLVAIRSRGMMNKIESSMLHVSRAYAKDLYNQ